MDFSVLFGIGLIVLGTLLLLLEIHAPGTFMLVPATVLMFLGVLGILFPGVIFTWWAPIAAVIVLVPTTFLTIKLYQRLSLPGPPETTVATSLVGMKGVVTVDVYPNNLRGKVVIENDTWSATSESLIVKGKNVVFVITDYLKVGLYKRLIRKGEVGMGISSQAEISV
jgi:membrane protein implicated in regulation of membrane protease activity